MKKIAAAAAAILLFALTAGCDGDPPAGSQMKIIEPCELITRSEAAQLIGEPLQEPEIQENKVVGQKLCLYDAAGEDSYRFFQVSITQQAFMPDSGQSPQQIYQSIKAAFAEADMVAEIGDDAFIAPPGLHILKDNYYITIAVGNSDDPKNREILHSAGRKAIARLSR